MADKTDSSSREKTIVRTGIIGIVANILLATFKALVGWAAHSTAMVLDAVNNLTDAISSIVTVIGTKIASKKADKKHPLGHGRAEYLSQMVIAALILYAGITALIESVQKIISPVDAEYTAVYMVIVGVAICVKIFLGLYFRAQGKKAGSDLLISSGTDALFDVAISVAVLISAIVFILFKVNIEAYVSIIISGFIIKTGFEIMREAVDDIMGHRVEASYTKQLKALVNKFPEVHGCYDVILHNYGPDRYFGSLHVEVDDTMTADKIDSLTREIYYKVYEELGIVVTSVGVYSCNTSDEKLMKIRRDITEMIVDHEHILNLHGFYIDEARKRITFDVVVDFELTDREGLHDHIVADVNKVMPGYEVIVDFDAFISD